jgi:hypothetical protein
MAQLRQVNADAYIGIAEIGMVAKETGNARRWQAHLGSSRIRCLDEPVVHGQATLTGRGHVLACINDGELRAPGEPCPGPNAPGGRGRRQFADFFIGQKASDLRGRHPLDAIPGHKPQARARPDYDAVQNIPIVVQDPVQRSKGTPGPGDNRCPLLQRRVGNGTALIIHCAHPLQDLDAR